MAGFVRQSRAALKRLTLFLKGNLDVYDSLYAYREGGVVKWNGINEVLRRAYPGVVIALRHETLTRSDALLQADGVVPDGLAARGLRCRMR